MKAVSAVLLALSVAASGCTSTTPAPSRQIDERYGAGGVRWNSGTVIYMLAGAYEDQGMVTLCSAWMVQGDSAVVAEFEGHLMRAAVVTIDGDRILQGLGFSTGMEFAGTDLSDYAGRSAACVRTDVAWDPRYESVRPRIKVPVMRIVI